MLDGFKSAKESIVVTEDGHTLHVEESGYPDGIPVLYLHGGPGAGIGSEYSWPFAGKDFRLIAFDQRGCGKSKPFASLENNNLEFLIKDIECIRKHFGIEKWMLFGGSWGSTLALIYAIEHPERVSAMVLRGIFLGRQQDADWFVSPTGGASQIFQNEYHAFLGDYNITSAEELCKRYYQDLLSPDNDVRMAAAERWYNWEGSISRLTDTQSNASDYASSRQIYTLALFECHYLVNHCFIGQNHILDNCHKISQIPSIIIHGRYDMICKCEAAIALHENLENASLRIIETAGHSMIEKGIGMALVQALEEMQCLLRPSGS